MLNFGRSEYLLLILLVIVGVYVPNIVCCKFAFICGVFILDSGGC